jgi:chromosome segregation ATPase
MSIGNHIGNINVAIGNTRREMNGATKAQKTALENARQVMEELEKIIAEYQEHYDALDSFVSDLESAIEEHERLEMEVNDITKSVLITLNVIKEAA